jgi:hypothetical protein
MYGGRVGYNGTPALSLGEREPNVFSRGGYGPYLGNFFDDLQNIASKVGAVSGELSQVASGEKKVGTFDPNKASLIIPMAGSPLVTAVPLLPLGIGLAALVYFAVRKRR